MVDRRLGLAAAGHAHRPETSDARHVVHRVLDRVEGGYLPRQAVVETLLAVILTGVDRRLGCLGVAQVDAAAAAGWRRVAGIAGVHHRRVGQRPEVLVVGVGEARVGEDLARSGLVHEAPVDGEVVAVAPVEVVGVQRSGRTSFHAEGRFLVEGQDRVAHVDAAAVRCRHAVAVVDQRVVDQRR